MHDIFNFTIASITQFILSIFIIAGFLIAWSVTKKIITKICGKKNVTLKNYSTLFITRIASTILFIMTIITLFSVWGIDVTSIIAGLGLTGFVLGFALKDVLASSVAGIMILFYQPFKVKSRIAVLNVQGIVTSIDMRYTTIEDDSQKHLIPNSRVLSEIVTILKEPK